MRRVVETLVAGCVFACATAVVSAQDYGEKVVEDYNTVLARQQPKADKWFYVRGAGKAPSVSLDDTLNTTDEWRRIAKWHVDMGDYESAQMTYRHFIDSKIASKDDLWNYVLVLKALGKHEETLPYMRRMRDKAPDDLRVKEYFRTVYNYNELKRQNPAYRIHDLDINTADHHYGAVYYVKDQVALLYAKNKRGKVTKNKVKQATAADNVDLYGVKGWQGDQWNKEILNGPFCFAKNGKFVAVTNIDTKWKDSLGVSRPQIFFSTMKQKKWLEPEPFLWNDTLGNYSVAMPALNKQGTMMIFASDRPGGYGGSDLWVVFKQGKNSWTEPVNLGDKINTEGDEMFPFLDQTTGKLYFSSNGHNGLGGLDIYEAVQKDSCLCSYEIKNLGAPMNSVSDDYAIVWNKKHTHGYFSSNRAEGKGGEDIYKFLYVSTKDPTIPHEWQGDPKGRKEGEKNNAQGVQNAGDEISKVLVVVNAQSDEPIAGAEIVMGGDTIRTDMAGSVVVRLPKDGEGSIDVHALGYQNRMLSYKKGGVTKSDTVAMRVAHGQHLVLKNIYYDFDQSDILPEAAKELDRLVAFMEDNPELTVELSSHTDSRGSDEYNLDLSQRRAEAAVEYVVGQGIDAERISAKGYGETKPLNGCRNGVECTEEQHRQNRRTEIFIPTKGAALNVNQTKGKFTTDNGKKKVEKPVEKKNKMTPAETEGTKKDKAKTTRRQDDAVVEDGSFQWHRKMTAEEEAALEKETYERQRKMDEEADAAEKAYEQNRSETEVKKDYRVIRHSDGTVEKRYTLY